jgi:hypothetical protein
MGSALPSMAYGNEVMAWPRESPTVSLLSRWGENFFHFERKTVQQTAVVVPAPGWLYGLGTVALTWLENALSTKSVPTEVTT